MTCIDIDIEDYLDEIDNDVLIEEMRNRGYHVKENGGLNLASITPNDIIPKDILREILLTLTQLGGYVEDEQIFDKLKQMLHS